jgi:vacuolar-type H+-ATPase subunit I/STV1
MTELLAEITPIQALTIRAETEFFKWILEEIVIENDEQLKNMSDLDGAGKKLLKAFEDARLEEKRPVLKKAEDIDKKYKSITSRIQLGVQRVATAIIEYDRKKKIWNEAVLALQAAEQRKKEGAAIQARTEEIQENTAKALECQETGEVFEPKSLTSLPKPEPLAVKPVKGPIRGNMGTTSIVETFEYTIIDEDAVERSLCSPDMKKIKARHQSGVKIIPGVLITSNAHTSTRGS